MFAWVILPWSKQLNYTKEMIPEYGDQVPVELFEWGENV